MDKSQRMCPECWQPYTIGRPHVCKPQAAPKPKPAEAVPLTVAHGPTHNPTHGPTHTKREKSALRKAQTYRWRQRYPDRWRCYHAEYMRRWRETKAIETAKAGGATLPTAGLGPRSVAHYAR
ncbi:MAG: hypothetical protein WBX25_29150 [Rhodomicrobium sp.]